MEKTETVLDAGIFCCAACSSRLKRAPPVDLDAGFDAWRREQVKPLKDGLVTNAQYRMYVESGAVNFPQPLIVSESLKQSLEKADRSAKLRRRARRKHPNEPIPDGVRRMR